MDKIFIALVAAMSMVASAAKAHEVSASSVTVHVDGFKVEILQTTPLATATQVASSVAKTDLQPANRDVILAAIGQSWQITGTSAKCRLERQAYRSQHHDTELQLRFLFVCDETEKPQLLEATWLGQTPPDHFLIFTINADGQSKTVIFEHQNLAIDISQIP